VFNAKYSIELSL